MVVIDAALIVEWGLEKDLDYLIFIDCPKKERIERLIQKKSYTKKEAEQRISSQLPEIQKRRKADSIIINNKGLAELKRRADSVWKKIINRLFDKGFLSIR